MGNDTLYGGDGDDDLIGGDLTYLGGSAFTGTGAEVRWNTSGSDLRVRIDVDGDGLADMKIIVKNITDLAELDFIL